jgi:cytochrome c oxidase assembly protein subunit 15
MLWLHRYNQLLALATLALITAGGLVTSTDSGLAVPDWPNTYGYFMFSFPWSQMVGGILYEHGHRLIASIVGLLTIGLVIWLSRREHRRWVRRLGWLALAAVVTQGLLGGITVLYFLPPGVSISHAGLAQMFFALIVSLAVFTSHGWVTRYKRNSNDERAIIGDSALRLLTVLTPASIYIQILIGATMRHTGAGLVIPDFPLAFGELIPPDWNTLIAVHFTHRVGAVIVTGLVVATGGHIWAHHTQRQELVRPVTLMIGVSVVQFTLGALTVLSERAVAINTAHVTTGALLFGTALVLGLRTHRDRFRDETKSMTSSLPMIVTEPTTIPTPGSSGASG